VKILIKLGGTLLENPDSLSRITREISDAASRSSIVVVHGGGKQMTRFLAERGVESRFVNGLRVTTPDVIDAVVKVFAGSVNMTLVGAFRAAGARPVGLTGMDAGLVDAELLSPDLGQVGKPLRSQADLLDVLVGSGFLPVVACVAGDSSGNVYNVNADQMAVACASAFRAEKLIFLTDVEGVRDKDGKALGSLTASEALALIRSGAATGGMQAKLESATEALKNGIGEVLIAGGAQPGILGALLRGQAAGTRLLP
jgi:acetylglutamate kinase